MINARSHDVVIHVPMEEATIRIAGIERKVLRPARGFAWVESEDGVQSPITNPLYDWIINAVYNGPASSGEFQFGFVFETGPRVDPLAPGVNTMDLGV